MDEARRYAEAGIGYMVQLARRDLIVGIPGALFLNALAGVLLERSGNSYLISYASFIFICCYWVVWEEYHNFPEIHDRKSPLFETLLGVVGTIGLINVLKAGTNSPKLRRAWNSSSAAASCGSSTR